MPILSACPHCGAKFELADEAKVGKKVRCPECEEPFVVKPVKSRPDKRPAKAAATTGSTLPPRMVGPKAKSKKKAKPADEAAGKKPKKKRKSSVGRSPALMGGTCVLLLVLLVGLPLVFSGGDDPLEPPADYAEFTHHVNSVFKCEYPAGTSSSFAWLLY